MLNGQGYVAEASGDNIFVIRKGELHTPPVWCGALDGITRRAVMQLAEANGYKVVETVMNRYDLFTADEIFLTGTAAEIIAVTEVDRRPIGGGKPGPITGKLLEAFHKMTETAGVLID